MKLRYVLLAVAGILMYNLFLIQRDEKMFKEYYRQSAPQILTPHQQSCKQQGHCTV